MKNRSGKTICFYITNRTLERLQNYMKKYTANNKSSIIEKAIEDFLDNKGE